MRRSILFLLTLLLSLPSLRAQTDRDFMAQHPEATGGLYYGYNYTPRASTPAPDGYEPFYISHYGRHGSRWYVTGTIYDEPLAILRRAAADGALTDLGLDVLSRVEIAAADAKGRYGDLTPKGVREQRGIAERMYRSFPEVFSKRDGRGVSIESRSTLVPRCILSMAAFNERLKELDPDLRITREASERYLSYMANKPGYERLKSLTKPVVDSVRLTRLHPRRLMNSLFNDPSYVAKQVKKPVKLMEQLFMAASMLQDTEHLNLSLYDIFTDGELFDMWEYMNIRRYLTFGPSQRFGDATIDDAKPLLRNIIETAEEVVDGRRDLAASLRFGHDTHIIPLYALLGVEGKSARTANLDELYGVWNDFRVSPMATNIQFVFFRNPATGDVLVKILSDEREVRLPLATDLWPYYRWNDLTAYARKLYE